MEKQKESLIKLMMCKGYEPPVKPENNNICIECGNEKIHFLKNVGEPGYLVCPECDLNGAEERMLYDSIQADRDREDG